MVVGCKFSARDLRGEVCVAWRGSQVGGKPGIYSDVEISTCAPKMNLSKYGKIHVDLSHSQEARIQLFRRRDLVAKQEASAFNLVAVALISVLIT